MYGVSDSCVNAMNAQEGLSENANEKSNEMQGSMEGVASTADPSSVMSPTIDTPDVPGGILGVLEGAFGLAEWGRSVTASAQNLSVRSSNCPAIQ